MPMPRRSGCSPQPRWETGHTNASPNAGHSNASFARVIAERLMSALVMGALLFALAPAPESLASDVAQLKRDVVTASDFRIRVSAALALGKKRDVSAVSALSQALRDDNGAVRAAAAAALGSIGDASAMTSLTRARDKEKDASVKRSIERAIGTLKALSKAKVVVSVTKLENKSGEPKVSSTFRTAVKREVARIPGVVVMGSEREAVAHAKARKLPTIALDARLTHLSRSTAGSDVAVAAKVELLIRTIPEQSLKATVKGDARALMSSRSMKGDAELAELREDAVEAAVASALKGAPTAIDAAMK